MSARVQRLFRCRQREIDVLVAVRERDDRMQCGRGCRVNSELEQLEDELPIRLPVNVLAELAIVPDRRTFGKHDLEHGPYPLHDRRNLFPPEEVGESSAQPVGNSPGVREGRAIIFRQLAQAGTRRVHPDARTIVRSVMQNAAPGQRFHHCSSSREGCDGEAAPECLAKSYKIWRELVIFLTATGRNPKAGYSFVENKKNAVLLCELL